MGVGGGKGSVKTGGAHFVVHRGFKEEDRIGEGSVQRITHGDGALADKRVGIVIIGKELRCGVGVFRQNDGMGRQGEQKVAYTEVVGRGEDGAGGEDGMGGDASGGEEDEECVERG